MKDYYKFRFGKPDSGTPKLAAALQDVVVMTGIPAVIIGMMASGSAVGKGDANAYSLTMVASAFFFYLMAKFSEDYPVVARWLIVIPALLLTAIFYVSLFFQESPTMGDLVATGVAVLWYVILAGVSIWQLRKLKS